MRELWIVYRDEMTLIVFIGSLIFWAVVMSILAFKNKTQVILIGNKGGSYQLIKADDKKTHSETENFIRHFLGLIL